MSPSSRELFGPVVGEAHVLTGDDLTAGYCRDWTGRFVGRADAVVRPGSTAEVAEIVAIANRSGVGLVVQGGNTSMVGGATPIDGGVVVSLTRIAHIDEVDHVAAQVTVEAGATLANLQQHLRTTAPDLAFGVDLSSRDSCTLGGMAATNAGGNRVVRYGSMRQQVVGIEAVLGDGSIVSRLVGLAKDNTGYDLAGLLTGSEGTLGIITQLRLRLVPEFSHRVAVGLGFATLADAVNAVGLLRARMPGLEALELMLPCGVGLVRDLGISIAPPFSSPACLIVEVAGHADPTDELAAAVHDLSLTTEPVVAVDSERRAALWKVRESHTEAINHVGVPAKLDVSVPLANTVEFVDSLESLVPTGTGVVIFGHLGDGNLHVNILGLLSRVPTNAEHHRVDEIERRVLGKVVALGGSISAEHGIGRAKVPYLPLYRSAEELAAFERIKSAFDPNEILNRGVLLSRNGR